ncbi:Hypothetical predicted protein [Mytilus galloprovincialis]|uniref:Cysteine and tyrosine-rich protein 1 n=1 Tax=Mytilus galloprovincialis TaxID=29158 RepID=A0A8B6GNT5_MYTGA|nr:Hypothetical predicted protein [Mytilus galloprovincialis]
MDLIHRLLCSAFLNLVIVVDDINFIVCEPGTTRYKFAQCWMRFVYEVSGEYCYPVYKYVYGYYYYKCETEVNGGAIAGAIIGVLFGIVFISTVISICKKKCGTRVSTIHTTPHHGGPTIITQQQQQHGPPPMMYGQYPQPGGPMYNQPPAYPPPQPNYPPPQGNYPPPKY